MSEDDEGEDRRVLHLTDVEEEAGLGDWRMLFATLRARFETGDFATGIALADRIAAAAEEANHHPDLDLTYPRLLVTLSSHDVGGVTERDLRLARTISGYAAEAGVAAAPERLAVIEIGLDSADADAVRPFWAAVLGLPDPGEGDEVKDPDGVVPTLWFQSTDAHETPRQRFHYDVRVPPEQAQARIDAAIAAGGTLVDDEAAPRFWVLADADGNKACITTGRGRSHPGG